MIVTEFRDRNKELAEFFKKTDSITYCHNIRGLFDKMNQRYQPDEWRLFVDGSKYSLKAALVNIGNKRPSIPIANAVDLKESYGSMKKILDFIKYEEHQWKICGDLEVGSYPHEI